MKLSQTVLDFYLAQDQNWDQYSEIPNHVKVNTHLPIFQAQHENTLKYLKIHTLDATTANAHRIPVGVCAI